MNSAHHRGVKILEFRAAKAVAQRIYECVIRQHTTGIRGLTRNHTKPGPPKIQINLKVHDQEVSRWWECLDDFETSNSTYKKWTQRYRQYHNMQYNKQQQFREDTWISIITLSKEKAQGKLGS